MDMHTVSEFEAIPGMYPYPRVSGGYLLTPHDNGSVHIFPDTLLLATLGQSLDEGSQNINDILSSHDVPYLDDRIPVVSYGANANPTILYRKLSDARVSVVVPTLKGAAHGYDIVHSSYLSKKGSIPCQMIACDDTEVDVWLSFFTPEQLHVIHESENLQSSGYFFGTLLFSDGSQPIEVYGYFDKSRKCFVDPDVSEGPLALASSAYQPIKVEYGFVPIDATDRTFTERTQKEVMDICSAAVREGEAESLYTSHGVYSSWAQSHLLEIGALIRERYGREFPTGEKEVIEDPHSIEGLKKFKDIA